jgi:hypothetical protein
VFTSETDPIGGVAPATLSYDGSNPQSLSPLLHQVFYIGDGRAGFDNATGASLRFTAPAGATRLYLGVADAAGWTGSAGFYSDNQGSFSVDVTLAPVPEPTTWALMLAGLGAVSLLGKRRRT